VLKNAPHTAQSVLGDKWEHPYSRESVRFCRWQCHDTLQQCSRMLTCYEQSFCCGSDQTLLFLLSNRRPSQLLGSSRRSSGHQSPAWTTSMATGSSLLGGHMPRLLALTAVTAILQARPTA
jgi:hypothetical protein